MNHLRSLVNALRIQTFGLSFLFILPIIFAESAFGENVKEGHLQQLGNKQHPPIEFSILQTRPHTKAGKFALGIGASGMNNDPFLNSSGFMAWTGLYFTENLGINLNFWRTFNTNSSAQDAAIIYVGYGANNNPISNLLTAELLVSALYGKVSLLGLKILHFDAHFLAGGGIIIAANGQSISPVLGIGQQLFITHFLSLRVDYRFFYFKEDIVERTKAGSTFGQVIGNRMNLTGVFTIGACLSI